VKVHTAQLAGGDNNADRVFVTDHAVIVLDGATAFEPVDVDPGTYADTLGSIIADQLDRAPDIDLTHAVADGIRNTTGKLHLDSGESPSSTVAILRAGHGSTDLYVLGGSPIYYGTDLTTHRFADDRLAALPINERTQYVEALRSGAGYDERHRATLTDLQRAQGAYRNRAGGYWIAETDPTAAGHGLTTTIPRDSVAWAVLATDGAADSIDFHGKVAWAQIARLDSAHLNALLSQLQSWESIADPNGQIAPRAKPHDDKTLASIAEL
jgi:hypothetical protein